MSMYRLTLSECYAGFTLLEVGTVQKKNIKSVLLKNVCDLLFGKLGKVLRVCSILHRLPTMSLLACVQSLYSPLSARVSF